MYLGHLNDGSSVQRHSAGDIYPVVIYGQQTPTGVAYGLITPRQGYGGLIGTYDEAHTVARCVKANDYTPATRDFSK